MDQANLDLSRTIVTLGKNDLPFSAYESYFYSKYALSRDDVANVIKMMKKYEKVRSVLAVHKNQISLQTRIKNGKERTEWVTRYGDNKKVKRIDYDAIIDFLFDYYNLKTVPTVQEAFESWLESLENEGYVSSLTIESYRAVWARFMLAKTEPINPFPKLNKPIDSVKKSDLLSFYRTIVGQCEPKKKAFKNLLTTINGTFAFANNMDNVSCIKPSELSTTQLTKRCRDIEAVYNPESGVYSREEVEKILNEAEKHPCDIYCLGIRLACCLGSRIGELRATHWEDYDADEKTLRLHRQMVARKAEKNGKTIQRATTEVDYMKSHEEHGRRTLNLNTYAVEVLALLFQINGQKTYILNSKGHLPISTNRFNEHLRSLCQKAGVEYRPSHKLRFYAATEMKRHNVEDETIQHTLGHASVTTTQHYFRDHTKTGITHDQCEDIFGRETDD